MSDSDVVAAPDSLDSFAAFIDKEIPSAPPAKAAEPIKSDPAQKPQADTAPNANGHPETDPEAQIDDPDSDPTESDKLKAGDVDGEATDDDNDPEKAGSNDVFEVALPDGKVEKVSKDELVKGYQRQADYTKGKQELAEKTKSYDAEFSQIKQRQVAALTALEERIAAFDPIGRLQANLREAQEMGDESLANSIRLNIIDAEKEMHRVRNALAWEKEQETQKETQETAQYITQQREALAAKLPWIAKDEGKQKFQSTVTKAMQKVGFTPEDMKGMTKPDHRQAILAYYAGKHLESLEAKPMVASALKGKAVVPQSGARSSNSGNSKIDAANRNMAKNPRSTDAFGAWLNANGV